MAARKRIRSTSPEGAVEILFLLYYSKEELNKSEILARLKRLPSAVTKYNVDSFIEWALLSQTPPLIIQTLRPDGWPRYSADRKTIKEHLKRYGVALPDGEDPLSDAARATPQSEAA